MPLQFCPEPGCHALVPNGRCTTHARQTRPDVARAHKWYVSARWLRLRVEVLQSEPFCRHCRQHGLKVLTTDVDHVVPHSGNPELFWHRANLQGLCKRCHSRKTASGQ